MKQYDKAYFDKWYRGRTRVNSPAVLRRKAAYTIASAEFLLQRPVTSVLDVGCGEGAWFTALRELRPRINYRGLDPSDYVVQRFGKRRGIESGGFADLAEFEASQPFDLIICSDVLHYVPDDQIRIGAEAVSRLLGGIAFLEVLTSEDEIVGDLKGLIRRPAAWYKKTFRTAGLTQIGSYSWTCPEIAEQISSLQLCD